MTHDPAQTRRPGQHETPRRIAYGRLALTLLMVLGALALANSWEFLRTREVIESFDTGVGLPHNYWRDTPWATHPHRKIYRVDRFNERRHGPFVQYYQQTSIRGIEGRYDQNKFDGVWTWWRRNGRVAEQKRYEDGKEVERRETRPWLNGAADQVVPAEVIVEPHGTFNTYYSDTAVIWMQERWHRGSQHGLTTYWDMYGRIDNQEWYQHGEEVEAREEPPWFEDNRQVLHGRLVYRGEYAAEFVEVAFDWDLLNIEDEECDFGKLNIAAPRFDNGQLNGDFLYYGEGKTGFELIYVGAFEKDVPTGVHTFRTFPPADESESSGLRVLWQGRFENGRCEERRTEPPFWPVDFTSFPPAQPYGTEAGVIGVDRAPRSVDGVSIWPSIEGYGESTMGEYRNGLRHGKWLFTPDYMGFTDHAPCVRIFDHGVLVKETFLPYPVAR